MKIKVKEYLGNVLRIEDSIVLRYILEDNKNKEIELDFEGMDRVPSTFFTTLFSNMINKEGREFILSKINVKNLSNKSDYYRVVKGTAF